MKLASVATSISSEIVRDAAAAGVFNQQHLRFTGEGECLAGKRLERAWRGDVDAWNRTRDRRRRRIRALRGLATDEAHDCNESNKPSNGVETGHY